MKILKTFLVAFCRTVLASAFWLAVRAGNSVTIRGVEHDRGWSRTYLGMTHKRDIDPFILVPTIIFHRGWKALAGDVRFALRGDGFSRGFRARMVVRPDWLARLLHPIVLAKLLRWLGVYPTDGLLRPAEEWLREVRQVDGDVLAGTMLAPAFLRDFAHAVRLSVEEVRTFPLSRCLSWDYHAFLQKYYGPEMLLDSRRRHIERSVVERIHKQQNEIVSCFWQGGSFFGSPEGQLSPDGHVSTLHAGFRRIMRAAPPDLRVVPISLVYDFMTTRRPRIFVNFAPAIESAPQLSQDALAANLSRSWRLHAYFTCTQLASGFLMERRCSSELEFTLDDLAHAIYQHAHNLAASGRQVDRHLLQPTGAARRARGYLAYVQRRGLVQRIAADCWKIVFVPQVLQVGPREVAYNDVPLLYAYNELQDLLSLKDND